MTLDKIIVIVVSLFGIGFTYWFFLGKKDRVATKVLNSADSTYLTVSTGSPQAGAEQAGRLQVDIIVDGGYFPEVIEIPKDKTTTLNFVRKDPSSCLEEVVISDFKVRKFLPLNQKISIEITPRQSGEFKFTCGMNMFHGKIIIK